MKSLGVEILGMTCEHCVRAVTEALRGVPGVEVRKVEIGSALVEYDPGRTTSEKIVEAITDEGYVASAQAAGMA